jgi:nucleoside-diphosphate-sugar epimerase
MVSGAAEVAPSRAVKDASFAGHRTPLMATYLVTGCAGFIGSHLAEALLDEGHAVIGIDGFTPSYGRAHKERNLAGPRARDAFRLDELDLAVHDARLETAVREVDIVFHLAAQPGVRTSWGDSFGDYVRHNVLASQRVFEACARAEVRVVLASSSSVYGNVAQGSTPESAPLRPISPYGVTKLSGEHLATAYAQSLGLDAVTLRYFTVFGPRQRPDMAFTRIAAALLDGTPFEVFGSGEQSRDFTFVADAVSATVQAARHAPPGAVYNVGGGEAATLAEVLDLFQEAAGRPLGILRRGTANGDVRRTSADTSALRSEFSWRPKVSLRDGIVAQLEWYTDLRAEREGAVESADTGRMRWHERL